MSFPENREPPRQVWYSLEEALELRGALEDSRDALISAGHLAEVLAVETQIRLLSRRLDFDDPEGDADVR